MSSGGFGTGFGGGGFGGGSPDGGSSPPTPPAPAPSAGPGGYGGGTYAEAYGAGGPLQIVRALAVAGQVVRVTFSQAPLTRSPAGEHDALNVANYLFSIDAGSATPPRPVGVEPVLVAPPARGVGQGGMTGERGVDIHVDRQLVKGITYRVTAKNLAAASGGLQGSPYSAAFQGVALVQATQLPARTRDLIDFFNDPATGAWSFGSGDVDPEQPGQGIRKRVLRRLTTQRGSFSWLPLYGLGVALKGVASPAQMAALRNDAVPQIKQEPETADASAAVSVSGIGLLTVDTKVRTRAGGTIAPKLVVNDAGLVVSVG